MCSLEIAGFLMVILGKETFHGTVQVSHDTEIFNPVEFSSGTT